MSELIGFLVYFLMQTGSSCAAAYLAVYLLKRQSKSGVPATTLVPVSGTTMDDSLAVHCRACDQLISPKAKRCPWCTSSL